MRYFPFDPVTERGIPKFSDFANLQICLFSLEVEGFALGIFSPLSSANGDSCKGISRRVSRRVSRPGGGVERATGRGRESGYISIEKGRVCAQNSSSLLHGTAYGGRGVADKRADSVSRHAGNTWPPP